MKDLRKGDRVTNARGWTGRLERIAEGRMTEDGRYYYVHWEERAQHEDPRLRKTPVLGHLRHQIWTVDSAAQLCQNVGTTPTE